MSSVGDRIDLPGYSTRDDSGRLVSGEHGYLMKRVAAPEPTAEQQAKLDDDIFLDDIIVWGGARHKCLGWAVRYVLRGGRMCVEVCLDVDDDYHTIVAHRVKFRKDVELEAGEEIVPGMLAVKRDYYFAGWVYGNKGTIRFVANNGLTQILWKTQLGGLNDVPWVTYKPFKVMADINDDGNPVTIYF